MVLLIVVVVAVVAAVEGRAIGVVLVLVTWLLLSGEAGWVGELGVVDVVVALVVVEVEALARRGASSSPPSVLWSASGSAADDAVGGGWSAMADSAAGTSCRCFAAATAVAMVKVLSLARRAPSSPFSLCSCRLARLAERRVKLPVMLTALSLRIMDDAEARTRCSLLERAVIPGKGSTSRVQTSARSASSRARSARAGASTGVRELVVRSDCDLLIDDWVAVGPSLAAVFLRMTWQSGDLGPMVVARWMDTFLAMVPAALVSNHAHPVVASPARYIPDFLKTVPRALMFNERKLKMSDCMWTWPSGLTAFRLVLSREHHSSSSFGEHAVKMSSYSWLPDKNTIFQEYRAVWHWSPASAVRIHKRELQSELLPRPLSTSSTLTLTNAMHAWTV